MERARVLLKTDAKTPNERQHHVLCGVLCYFIRKWRQQWPATAREPGAVRQARPAAISEMSATVAVYRYIMLASMDAASAAEPLTDRQVRYAAHQALGAGFGAARANACMMLPTSTKCFFFF